MQALSPQSYCFEEYTLDLKRGCLRKVDRQIDLRPKSFAVLRHLIENAGRLVSKDELVKIVWPKVIVSDEYLTQCVSEVRLGRCYGVLMAVSVSTPASARLVTAQCRRS